MQTSLTFANIAALAGVMIAGAMVPSVSVLTVFARSAALGFAHGVLTAAGIVLGDVVFILIAIYGLSLLATWLDNRFFLIHYLGGVYLIWLGVMLWRSRPKVGEDKKKSNSSLLESFLSGLLITLGDQKAIWFYLGVFPAFLDLTRLSYMDTSIVVATAVIAVGVPKVVYAYMGYRTGGIFKVSRVTNVLNRIAGSVMIAVGGFVIIRA